MSRELDRSIVTLSLGMLLVVAALAGAAAARPRPAGPTAHERAMIEYAPYDSAGSGTILGAIVVRAAPGTRVSLSARDVVLRPATTWSRQWWIDWVLEGRTVNRQDPLAAKHMRSVRADSMGQFSFADLPAGDYYLVSTVLRSNGNLTDPQTPLQRIVLGKFLRLAPGERVAVSLDSLRSDALPGDRNLPGISRPTVPDPPPGDWGLAQF